MGHYNFEIDLPNSKKSVLESAKLLESNGIEILDKDYHGKEYDIETANGEFVEVKEDFECHKTGNVAVEYESRGKKSGISITKAGLFIYKIHEKDGIHFRAMHTNNLKKIIEDKKYIRDIKNGGDPGSETKIYLFKLEEIKKISTELKYKSEVQNA